MMAVVCPSNRPESLARWRREWKAEFEATGARIYEVLDEAETWMAMETALGPTAAIISRRSDGIRCWGFYQAWLAGSDLIVTLDDDCYPDGEPLGFLSAHRERLTTPGWRMAWQDTIDSYPARGLPAHQLQRLDVRLNMGGWTGIPDLDGEFQLAHPEPYRYRMVEKSIPVGTFFPMSAMNLAFDRRVTPLLWFPPMGDTGQGRHRFGDIWAGLFAKRILDHLGWGVQVGAPRVRHLRASDPFTNARMERKAKAEHETLWPAVAAVRLPDTDAVPTLYAALADRIPWPDDPYWTTVWRGMRQWAELFQ